MMLRLLAFFLLLALPLHAAEAVLPQVPVLVVDVKRVLDESKASVAVQKKIEAQRSAFQTEIAVKEKFIRDAEQDLLASRNKIDAAAYAEKETQLRQKFRDVEQYVQARRQSLEQATTLSMGKVRAMLLGIVTEIAHRRGAQAVLTKQQVLWTENALDITDQVLERLNTQLPDLPVNIEPPKEVPAADMAPVATAPAPAAKTGKKP